MAFYIVKKGDTLYSIARQYGISTDKLMVVNNIKKGKPIISGQRLIIPVIKPAPQKGVPVGLDSVHFSNKPKAVPKGQNSVKSTNPFATKLPAVSSNQSHPILPDNKLLKYKIKSGDNFEKIEKAFWLKPGQLKKANPNLNPKNLKIGQEINIPQKEYYYKPYDKNDETFSSLISKVLKSEGGINSIKGKDGKIYVVNKGIQQVTYDAYLKRKAFDNKTTYKTKSVKNITDEEVKEIYYNDYYLKSNANNAKDKKTAYWMFDTAVQCGVSEAQRLSKICKNDTDWYNERLKIYNSYVSKDSSNKRYLNGWQNRINSIKKVVI
ncbi:LysM peptidoglycan-binding domain-containing protein [bacterium]|nr:LysM peptidoglycan-binding domain-containing protein [bacterium]